MAERIYLASASPRRRELLKQIGVGFEMLLFRHDPVRGADLVDETPHAGEAPDAYVMRLARAKAEAGWQHVAQRKLRRFPLLAADTCVALDGTILGKPRDRDDAAEMLRALSGREHHVHTAVAIKHEAECRIELSTSVVKFRDLDPGEIVRYVATGEPLDKAGAYAIQGRAAIFVEALSGSYSGVMGLPVFETARLLEHFGYRVL